MTKPVGGSEILKTDRRGRVRLTRERREQLLDEFEKSDLRATEFARVVGLKYQTFANWRQLRRRARAALSPALAEPAKPQAVQWLEAVIDKAHGADSISASALVVRLPSGAAIELAHVSQASLAAALLRAWEKSPC